MNNNILRQLKRNIRGVDGWYILRDPPRIVAMRDYYHPAGNNVHFLESFLRQQIQDMGLDVRLEVAESHVIIPPASQAGLRLRTRARIEVWIKLLQKF